MPSGKVNPTGCTERYGLIQVRLDFFLEKGDARYDDPRFYQVDPTSKEYLLGYTGKLDKEGQPRDLEAYAAWEASLPRIWLPERCFHHHFIYLDPYTLRDEQITDAIGLHLPNFYKAWTEEWDKVQGGMRHGWDVATRRPRPTRFNIAQPELYVTRQAECLRAVDVLRAVSLSVHSVADGELFPSTEIDIGDAATDRASYETIDAYTVVSMGNPANATGSLDSVDVYLNYKVAANLLNPGLGLFLGTFVHSGSNVLTVRDSQNVGDDLAVGLRSFTGLDIDVAQGDYIGLNSKATGGTPRVDKDNSGGSGYWRIQSEVIDPQDSATFSVPDADAVVSLYGTGETSVDVYTSDALRRIAKVSVYAADSIRTLRAVQSYEADAIRALQGTQTYCADALRMLCAEDFYAADTVRVVVLTLNDIYPADTRRQIQTTDSYSADALRALLATQSYSADSRRRNVESAVYAADTFRLVYADAIYQADALRAILGWQAYDADTLRPIQEDQYDRYPADTKRLIYIVQPFKGRPFVLEIRNQSGQLLAIPRLLSGKLTQALNAPDVLRATIPADDPAREHINPSNLLYVRDDSGAIVSICSPVICERESQ